VIDAMDEYQIDQHQVDKVFSRSQMSYARQQAFRSVARSVGTRHCRMVDTRVCCDHSETQGRMR
jgi:hypothetical protein